MKILELIKIDGLVFCSFARQRDMPSASTFSRAFAEFATTNLGTLVNDALEESHNVMVRERAR